MQWAVSRGTRASSPKRAVDCTMQQHYGHKLGGDATAVRMSTSISGQQTRRRIAVDVLSRLAGGVLMFLPKETAALPARICQLLKTRSRRRSNHKLMSCGHLQYLCYIHMASTAAEVVAVALDLTYTHQSTTPASSLLLPATISCCSRPLLENVALRLLQSADAAAASLLLSPAATSCWEGAVAPIAACSWKQRHRNGLPFRCTPFALLPVV